MDWQADPVEGVSGLAATSPGFLGPKTPCADGTALALYMGQLSEEVAGVFGSQARQRFEETVFSLVVESLVPHVTRVVPPKHHTQGTVTSVWLVGFAQTGPATMAKQSQADCGRVVVTVGAREVEVPVRLSPGMQPADQTVLKVSNLPMDWAVKGLVRTLLGCAGYGSEVVVQQEYGGEVAGALVSTTGPALVRGDVAMAVVRAPEGDRELRALPSCFSTCAGMVRISVLTAKGHRVAPPDVASQAEQAPPGPSGMQAARWVMRQQGWREGQVLGAGQTGLRRPVDAFTDLGGRPSNNRTGMGFFEGGRRPGRVPAFVHAGAQHAQRPTQTPDDSESEAADDSLGGGSAPPPPPPPPPPRSSPAPAPQDFMDGALSGVVPSHPLTEGCLLWLEDRYPRASLADRRGLVCELYTACPTLCADNLEWAEVVPPEGVRRELTVRAGQWGWHASTSYAGSAAGDSPKAQEAMDQEEGPGSRAGAAAVVLDTPRRSSRRQRSHSQGCFHPAWAPGQNLSYNMTPPPPGELGGGQP